MALFSDVPFAGHGVQYASTFEGCTDIHLPIKGSQQVMFMFFLFFFVVSFLYLF